MTQEIFPIPKSHANGSPQPFHTDPDADILAFYTRSNAASGGKCIISPGYTIYNELASTRPDIIATLARADWPFALYVHPTLTSHLQKLICPVLIFTNAPSFSTTTPA
jgi:hypothetical protein